MNKGFSNKAIEIGKKLSGNTKAISRLKKAYEVVQKRIQST